MYPPQGPPPQGPPPQGPYGAAPPGYPPQGYGGPPAYPPQGYGGPPGYPQQGYGGPAYYGPGQFGGHAPMVMIAPKSPSTAVLLELLPGFFFQTIGFGNIYAGNVGIGIALMLGYWFVLFINAILCSVIIGFITLPLCWIGAMILSSILASNAAKDANARLGVNVV